MPMNCNKSTVEIGTDIKDQQLKVLQETIRNLQTQLLEKKSKENEKLMKIKALEEKLRQANVKTLLLKTKIVKVSKDSVTSLSDNDTNDSDKDVVCIDDTKLNEQLCMQPTNSSNLDRNKNVIDGNHQFICIEEVHLIGLLSSFLIIHPYGASLENILTYVKQISMELNAKDVENTLRRHKIIFDEVVASNETKWKFCGFEKKNQNIQANVNQFS